MKERSFHDRIHTIGRFTVICALVSFMAVPFVLAMVNHIPMNIPQILQNAFPILLTFSISGICENLSFMPIIGSGALYMACVTGNVSTAGSVRICPLCPSSAAAPFIWPA